MSLTLFLLSSKIEEKLITQNCLVNGKHLKKKSYQVKNSMLMFEIIRIYIYINTVIRIVVQV